METQPPDDLQLIRVLAVDDDPNALQVLRAYSESASFLFYGIDTPEDAMDLVRVVLPDVILTDAMMPGMSGFDLCRQLRTVEDLTLVPIVMVTNLDAREDRIRALNCGAQDFLTKPVDRMEFLARVRSLAGTRRLIESLESADKVLQSLALCAEARDRTTGEHCARLRSEGLAFGSHLQLSRHEIAALGRAGYLHDIGKIAIPDSILQKPGKLTAEEWEVMKSHAHIGADLLAPLSTMRMVLPIVRHHHERWDGKGYPDGLAGEAIPLLARVFQLLDAWDALTHERPYKPALSPEESLQLMQKEAAQGRWDPHLFKKFKAWKGDAR